MDLLVTHSMLKNKNSSSSNNLNNQQESADDQLRRQMNISRMKTNLSLNNSKEDSFFLPYYADHEYGELMNDEPKSRRMLLNLLRAANEKLDIFVNNESIRKPHQVIVKVFLIFLSIGEIDNVKEQFQADAYIESCWEDNDVHLNETGEYDPSLNWDPEIGIENAMRNLKQDITYRVEKNGKIKVIEMRQVKGFFWERLELWDFPLDIQNLSITVTSAKSHQEVKFERSDESECAINTNDFRQQQEWNLYSHYETSEKIVEDLWKNYNRPCFTVSSTVSRKPGYFLYNAYMLIFVISSLGFTPFSFAYSAPHFRIQTTCLLILSSVNFRWIVTQKLPTVSYLTTLDKYAISALVFLVLLCIWHALIASALFNSYSSDFHIRLDTYVLISIACFYLAFHVVYIFMFLKKYRRYKDVGPSDITDEDMKKDDDLSLSAPTAPAGMIIRSNSVKPDNNNQIQNFDIGNTSEIKYRNLIESSLSSDSSTTNVSNNNFSKTATIADQPNKFMNQQQQQQKKPTSSGAPINNYSQNFKEMTRKF